MIDIHSLFVGAVCTTVSLQPTADADAFVVNFQKEETRILLRSFSMVRLVASSRVQYTVFDRYFNTKGTLWRNGQKKLSSITFPKLKSMIIGHSVTDANMLNDRDIVIKFDNAAELNFIVDASPTEEDDEVHRIIIREETKRKNSSSEHTVIFRDNTVEEFEKLLAGNIIRQIRN